MLRLMAGLFILVLSLPVPPVVTSITPASAQAGSASSVTINGSGFAFPSTAVSVTFGSTAATNVVVTSAVLITCTAPALSAGVCAVTVTNPAAGATSALSGTLAGAYTALAPAAPGQWTATGGFQGGMIRALAIDPVTPATVYAGTWDGGVFKTP